MNNETKECTCGCSCGKKAVFLGGTALIAAALAFGACRLACCGGSKIMVVDFDRVQTQAVVYKAILDNQRGYEEKIHAQINLEGGQLDQEEKELVAQKGKLSETDFKKKAVALQKKAMEFQGKYRMQTQQILMASQMAASKVQAEVEEVLKQVAKKAGADVVVSKAVTIYMGEKVDLTDRFVEALNEQVKPVEYPNPETIQPQFMPRGQ